MPWWVIAAAIVALTVVMVLIQPKPKFENARAGTLDDLRFPQAREGMPVGLALGTVRIRAPNTVWYGDFEARAVKKKMKTGLFSSKKVTIAHRYFIGLDLVLCLGPMTALKKIWLEKDIIWTGNITASGTAIVINKPNLFGGKGQGGGFVGTLRFYLGNFPEAVNAYLTGEISDPLGVPAYNGKCRIVAEHVEIGESPQLRPLSFELQRLTDDLGLVNPTIGDDLNPAELLYQVVTQQWGGMSVDPLNIDLPSWLAAGATLFTEGNGMSLLITNSNSGKSIVGEVLRQIDGLLYQDPETSKMVLKLIREDYDVLSLPVLDETNVSAVLDFASNSWTDTINQYRVTYTNRDNSYEPGTAMAKDMANIYAQDRLKTTTASFPGVTTGDLANVVAHRELSQLSVPLFKITLELNRTVAYLRPGDPFIFSWPEYNLESMVMRVHKFNLGDLLNGKLVLEAIQDRFAIASTVIASPGGSTWVAIPDQLAGDIVSWAVRESHYFFFQAGGVQGGLSAGKSGILVAAEGPDASAQYAEVNVSKDAGVTYDVALEQLQFTAIGTLQTTITATSNLTTGVIAAMTIGSVTIAEVPTYTADEQAGGSGLFLIGGEYFRYASSVDGGGGQVNLTNISRALLDGAPAAHSIGDAVYFLSGDNVVDDAYDGAAVLRVKLLNASINEVQELADVTHASITLYNRVWRPAAPAYIRFNGGAAFVGPANPSNPVTVTWANRDRRSVTVRGIADATSEYEDGQQTTIRYRINAGAWVASTYAPGVVEAVITTGATAGQTVDWEIYSTRDALDSFNKWTFTSTGGGASGSGGGGSSPDTGGPPPSDATPAYVAPPTPYGFAFGPKTPVALKLLAVFDTPIAWTLPASLTDSQGTIVASDTAVAAAPSAQTDFDIQSPPGTSIGTMRFAASSLTATFINAAEDDVPVGQILYIVSPANLNGITGAIAGSIKGTRS